MTTAPAQLTLKLILDAGVAFMGLMSGGLKDIAPPEMPKLWVILGTITAAIAFFTARLLLILNSVQVSRDVWLSASIIFAWLAVVSGLIYLLTRFGRTVIYEGQTILAGTDAERLEDVANDPQNAGKTREELILDAGGIAGDVWTNGALIKSRRVLGIEYTVFIMLLAFGLYLGIEAYNSPQRPQPVPTFPEKIAKLRDVHFGLNGSDLNADAADLLNADAEILKDAFKQFNKATVILEGYCDDRGTDEYNFALGYRRAEAARQVLLAAKIDSQKLTVSSHGKKGSVCPENDDSCREKNRRVHLIAIQN